MTDLLSHRDQLTPGNVDDRRLVPKLIEQLWKRLVGDKVYLSQLLTHQLFQTQLPLPRARSVVRRPLRTPAPAQQVGVCQSERWCEHV